MEDAPGDARSSVDATAGTAAKHKAEAVLGAESSPNPRREPHSRLPPLSAAQLAGQHVVFAFEGAVAPPELLERIRRGEAAGVILFRRNVVSREQLAALAGSLHAAARHSPVRARLLVMVDEEGGQISRLPWLRGPSAVQVGNAGDPYLAYTAGRSAGRALRRLGVTVNLAPVADVATPGSVLERYERTYARDPRVVAELASAFADGVADAGVAPAAKHFPGFGAARSSTDHRGVVIRRSAAALASVDAMPFELLVRNGVRIVMTSTAVYPALSPRPAALSRAVVRGLLRRALDFDGVVMTDDLETPATMPIGGPEELAEAAVAGGNDLVIFAKTYAAGERAAAGLQAAIAADRLSRRGMRQSTARVIELRRVLTPGGGAD